MQSIDSWSPEEVGLWLQQNGFDNYVKLFRDQHKIDGKCLLVLTEDDLRSPPLELKVLGDIKRIIIAIRTLQRQNAQLVNDLTSLPNSAVNNLSINTCDNISIQRTNLRGLNSHKIKPNKRKHSSSESDYESTDEEPLFTTKNNNIIQSSKKEIRPEAWKALVAMIYFFTATWTTAIVMVIVHDRVPDMETYPPLPDIFLDNVPLIPWAFQMCEICGLILFTMWCFTLIFHKHRFIILRRTFSLFGSVFFLRCFTMLITSLSVPGRHLKCKARPYGSWLERSYQAFLIWQGGGMSIQGVRTCGDYMFSGHTVVLTLLNFFITEYTPIKLYFIHTVSWVLNLFGIFFILAAHEHYSIDVFIAFYISTRLFLYYHTLANNKTLYQGDRKRTRIWFPLFYFFESGVRGRVPNYFESPFRLPKWPIIKCLYSKIWKPKSD